MNIHIESVRRKKSSTKVLYVYVSMDVELLRRKLNADAQRR